MADLHSYGTFLNEKVQQSLQLRRHRQREGHTATQRPIDTTRWMAALPDAAYLSSLTLPGTHDSAAWGIAIPFVSTQNLALTEQLDAGVRYLDLRCGLVHNEPQMVHGRISLGRTLEDCLADVYAWLEAHPSEALVVQIKEDRAPDDSTLGFADAVLGLLAVRRECWRFCPSNPTLGETRGRIQLFRRFGGPKWAGVSVADGWVDNPVKPFTIHTPEGLEITVQDHYQPDKPSPPSEFVADKEADVLDLLARAEKDDDDERWYLNFCTAAEFNIHYQLTPYEVAVGKWWNYTFTVGINPRLTAYLKAKSSRKTKRRYGVVALDFFERPDPTLVTRLIRTNFGAACHRWRASTISIWALAILLALVFVGGTFVVALHGPVDGLHCYPYLHSCFFQVS